jgi:hypothetical protein
MTVGFMNEKNKKEIGLEKNVDTICRKTKERAGQQKKNRYATLKISPQNHV